MKLGNSVSAFISVTQGCELGRNRSVLQTVANQGLFLIMTWLSLGSTVQKKKNKKTLYERHDREEMRVEANYFVIKNGRHIT